MSSAPALRTSGYCTSGIVNSRVGQSSSGGKLSRVNVSTCADVFNGMLSLSVYAWSAKYESCPPEQRSLGDFLHGQRSGLQLVLVATVRRSEEHTSELQS